MKKYISPAIKPIRLEAEILLAGSNEEGGLDGGKMGREFNNNDASYSNRRNSIWGDEF